MKKFFAKVEGFEATDLLKRNCFTFIITRFKILRRVKNF